MNSSQAPSVLAQLKESTAAEHVAIEKAIDWERRFSTRAGYVGFLRQWLAVYRAAETELSRQPWPEIGLDFESRRKTGWLEHDLRVLGEDGNVAGETPGLPRPASLAEAIGALYVLEGATLGGQFISRQLEGLGITAATGGSFYAGYGPATGQRWAEFRQLAAAYCGRPDRIAAAVEGARAMFAALLRAVPAER